MKTTELIAAIESGTFDENFRRVYVQNDEVQRQKERCIDLIKTFIATFGEARDVIICSAPGRTEVCGNHTDHNHGKVLAASVNLDAVAVASVNQDGMIRVKSKGHAMNVADLSDMQPDPAQFGHSTSMVKGVAAGLHEWGYTVSGFDACTDSEVMGGSGLSSSAAFEVLVATCISALFNEEKIDAVTLGRVAQYSENKFFGKPCGLLDQMTSAVGTFVTIDFKDTASPDIRKIDVDFESFGHSLCIVDTGGSHSDLTDDYAAVRSEMESVARAMGCSVLRETTFEAFLEQLPALYSSEDVNDRALLRAYHFYQENMRVDAAVAALEEKDFERFKQVIVESGRSSYMYNQNVFTPKNPTEQKLSLALALSEHLLAGKGAYRVHGGGFAGTIQAFVPQDMLQHYKTEMERVFGAGSCHVLSIRPCGGVRVL